MIGVKLPLDKLLPGLAEAAAALSETGGPDAARAIMTTDTQPEAGERLAPPASRVGGMAKGAGMIHPRLATMLAVVTTDYPLEPGEPEKFLRPAVERSFNRISVDGDCSTNDTVILLANGAERDRAQRGDATASSPQPARAGLPRAGRADRQGRRGLHGAARDRRPRRRQRRRRRWRSRLRIASSPLVKTAAFGHDPNWGRVMMAAGSAPWHGGYAELDPSKVTLAFNGTEVLVDGAHVDAAPRRWRGRAAAIELDLGLGDGAASYLASDLSYEYVRINAEYTT